MISVSVPAMSRGWTKNTGVPCAPMRISPSTRLCCETNQACAAWMSGTSKARWCWPPCGLRARKFVIGELASSGASSSIWVPPFGV